MNNNCRGESMNMGTLNRIVIQKKIDELEEKGWKKLYLEFHKDKNGLPNNCTIHGSHPVTESNINKKDLDRAFSEIEKHDLKITEVFIPDNKNGDKVAEDIKNWKPIRKKMKLAQHKLKTWPQEFKDICSGEKTFEVRKNDRNFSVGDILVLREFVPCKECNGRGMVRDYTDLVDCCEKPHGKYTGKKINVIIKYILNGGQFGIEKDYVVMSVKKF